MGQVRAPGAPAPPRMRQVIRVAIEGFSQAEVAVELGLTEAAARKRYQRAMRRLHAALEEIP